MTKEIFKNLPDTSTPLSASKLNGLFDGEESMGSIVVEDVVCKNMFNKNDVVVGSLNADGSISSDDTFYTSNFIRVKPNTIYHKTISGNARLKYYYSDKTQFSNVYNDLSNAQNDQAFTIPNNVYYIRLTVGKTYIDTFQLEPGSVATNYVEHKEFNSSGTILWTNPNPKANIGYTYEGITLANDDFNELEFWFYRNTDNDYLLSSKTKKGYGALASYTNGYTGTTYSRFLKKESSDIKYTINDCYKCGAGITPPNAVNSDLIPAFIIGYKN